MSNDDYLKYLVWSYYMVHYYYWLYLMGGGGGGVDGREVWGGRQLNEDWV